MNGPTPILIQAALAGFNGLFKKKNRTRIWKGFVLGGIWEELPRKKIVYDLILYMYKILKE